MTTTLPGICGTCNDGPTCVRLEYHKQPVWYCEEFDDYVPQPDKTDVGKDVMGTISALKSSKENEVESAKYSGLCVNCDNSRTCAFSRHESEIWQCNEYA